MIYSPIWIIFFFPATFIYIYIYILFLSISIRPIDGTVTDTTNLSQSIQGVMAKKKYLKNVYIIHILYNELDFRFPRNVIHGACGCASVLVRASSHDLMSRLFMTFSLVSRIFLGFPPNTITLILEAWYTLQIYTEEQHQLASVFT